MERLKGYKQNVKQYISIKKKVASRNKIPLALILFITLECLTIGSIALEVNSPPRSYNSQSLTPWDSNPLEQNETRRISFSLNNTYYSAGLANIPIASGQSSLIKVTSDYESSIKLILIKTWEERPDFTDESSYENLNDTYHHLTISPEFQYRILYVFIKNLSDSSNQFQVSLIVYGLNSDYLIIPALILLLYIVYTLCIYLIRKSFTIVQRSSQKINQEHSMLKRIRLISQRLREEIGTLQIIILICLFWIVIQPFVPLAADHPNGNYHPLRSNLRLIEKELILPLPATLFIIAIFICIQTGELIASKKIRGDIAVVLTLPFSRTEWICITGFGLLTLYGTIFGIIIILKATIISLKLQLIYPIPSFLIWSLLITLTISTWIFTGLISSNESYNKYGAAIFGVGVIMGLSVIMLILEGGILMIEGQSYELWPSVDGLFLPDVQHNGWMILDMPKLDILIPTLFITGIWFISGLIILVFRVNKFEMK
jgi:hypothetical protein